MAPQWRAAAKDGKECLFIVPQKIKVWLVSAEYALEKDKITPKNIFLFIPLDAHGGIPYFAVLIIVYQMGK